MDNQIKGCLLKICRLKQNMTQVRFAKEIGTNAAMLSQMELGARAISKDIEEAVKQRFHIDLDLLLALWQPHETF